MALGRAAESSAARASRALEAALLVEPRRVDVRGALARLTLQRLELAELAHRAADVEELRGRLALYDDGAVQAQLELSAHLDVRTVPSGVAVTAQRGDQADAPTRELGRTPLTGAALAPGTWWLTLTPQQGPPARVPLLLGRGEALAVDVPLAASVPEGFAYVPKGRFLFGSGDEDSLRRFFTAPPLHELSTGGYFIARTEVTFAQWLEFLDALPATERRLRTPHLDGAKTVFGGDAGLALTKGPKGWELHLRPTSVDYSALAGAPLRYAARTRLAEQDWLRMPVSAVSAEDGEAYAAWLSSTGRVPRARLCNELEWEKAGRGADGRKYPAGDTLSPDDANIDLTYGRQEGGYGPDAVGAHPGSRSGFGVDDLSGNVWELTRAATGDGYAMRGGGWFTDATTAHLANHERVPGSFRHLHVGLRLCADGPQ
jgi:formylglycine-generating enzyme required for sulfatase activity